MRTTTMKLLLPLLLLTGILAGCGQKGPLYLPEENSQFQSTSSLHQ